MVAGRVIHPGEHQLGRGIAVQLGHGRAQPRGKVADRIPDRDPGAGCLGHAGRAQVEADLVEDVVARIVRAGNHGMDKVRLAVAVHIVYVQPLAPEPIICGEV